MALDVLLSPAGLGGRALLLAARGAAQPAASRHVHLVPERRAGGGLLVPALLRLPEPPLHPEPVPRPEPKSEPRSAPSCHRSPTTVPDTHTRVLICQRSGPSGPRVWHRVAYPSGVSRPLYPFHAHAFALEAPTFPWVSHSDPRRGTAPTTKSLGADGGGSASAQNGRAWRWMCAGLAGR